MAQEMNPRRMTTAQAAEYLGLAAATLVNHRVKGTGPEYFKIGKVFYSIDDLDKYVEAGRVVTN